MALSDFYAVNHNYSTRLSLLTKDSGNDVIAAASTDSDIPPTVFGSQRPVCYHVADQFVLI
ncbi:hypothetical protein CFP56_031986 [Quercus suber]|uniref:Uncharacterized protein n=1 Tax=Quercus suber TaxID=58331 RepID=A0AAW0JJ44_QUESU